MIDLPRPTRKDLLAARNRTVPDLIAPNLTILFCGINPGLYSAAVSHHFARPGNRFWPALHAGGFTDRILAPHEERELLPLGYGITNIASRATATADQLTPDELRSGARRLLEKVHRYRPRWLAVVGITAYRVAFDRPKATLGMQQETLAQTRLWVLPNPSGLNAHHTPADLARLFKELHRVANQR